MKHFIAIQTGARRNYAVPSILQKAGMLEIFYTDLCANAGLGTVLNHFCPQSLRRGVINRLLNRRVPPNLEGKVYTFDWVALRYLARQKLAGNNLIQQHQALSAFNQEFGQAMISRSLGQATHIFSMFGAGTDFIEFAKNQNIRIISEIFISPLTYQIIEEDKKTFCDMEPLLPNQIIESAYSWFGKLCNSTDVFIAPSKFVKRGVQEFGVDQQKCYIVPYAVGDSWLKLKNLPTKGRVLFVGTAELRKGIHVLGMAAHKLNHRNYEFRVAGGFSHRVHQHRLTQKLNFLGRIPRSNIQQEYAQADIFVLPSLAEGSAEVTYEALAAGLPIITTEAAGSVIRDGIEGFIIPERDPDALANRIEELVENRELRDRMAVAARERAKDYTWDKYAERLMEIVQVV